MNSRITAKIAEVRAQLANTSPAPWAHLLDEEITVDEKDKWGARVFGVDYNGVQEEQNIQFACTARELVPALLKALEKAIEQRDWAFKRLIDITETRPSEVLMKEIESDAEISDLLDGKEGK